ncbi:hypothetical protein Tco_1104667 [Tanacetum coccineum]
MKGGSRGLRQQRVHDLEQTKTTQAEEIVSLKRRVKKLEQNKRSRTHRLKRLYKVGLSRRVKSSDEEGLGEKDASKQGRIADIDADAGIKLVSTHFDADTNMFRVHDLVGDEVVVESEVVVKASEKRNVVAEIDATSTILVGAATITDDKGKAKMIEPKPVKTLSKKDQLMLDEELTFKLQDEKEEKERLAREKLKLIITKRAEEKRNIPPTRDQQRSIMCTYLKNMEGWKPKSLKNKSFANIQELFDKAMKRVNTFVDYRTELVEETKIKELIEIVLDEEEVAIDVIPLAVKSPSIVDWKIHKEGKKNYYQIIRADRSSKMYLVFSHMLKSFNREDLETFYKLVKAKYGSTRPVEDLDLVLYGYLKTMFEPHVEDRVWRNQQDYIGRIVGIKRLLDDLKVTAAQVCVTAAKLNSKIKTAERVSTVKERIKIEERIKDGDPNITIEEYIRLEEEKA